MLKVIKNEEEYNKALSEIDNLLEIDPAPDTEDSDRLELLILLVEKYESETIERKLPDPIDAIKFRMEQQNLSQRDLIPFIGSRSKVSEVLSRKRPLTLKMIRALYKHLGIPAKVLLQDGDPSLLGDSSDEWERYPISDMIKYGWIKVDNSIKDPRDHAEEIMRPYISESIKGQNIAQQFRQTNNIRSAKEMDHYALTAWTARVIEVSKKINLQAKYNPDIVDMSFLRRLAKLSWSEQGPVLAREFLARNGIALVIERHLPKTYLDGAAVMISREYPVIALTIRYDRIDNFWFTLMHEMAHLVKHLNSGSNIIYDDLDVNDQGDSLEREADALANEALIPADIWVRSEARISKTPSSVKKLAEELEIHPAIIAGKIRHESKNYRILRNLVGPRKVRILFPEVCW